MMNDEQVNATHTGNEELDSDGSGTQAPGHVPALGLSEIISDPTKVDEFAEFMSQGMNLLRKLRANDPDGNWEMPFTPARPEPPVPRRPALGSFEQAMHDAGDELHEIIYVPGGRKTLQERMQKFAQKVRRLIAFMAKDFDEYEAEIRQDLQENYRDVPEEEARRCIDESKRFTATMMILDRHRQRRLKREQLKNR